MSSKPLPLSFARCLIRLKRGDRLNPGEFVVKNQLKQFCEDGIIQMQAVGYRRFAYYCPNPEVLQNYLSSQHNILSLENYIDEFENTASDGESSLCASKSTKIFRNKSLQGFFIKTLNSAINISGEMIRDVPDGLALFVHQPEKLQISKTALIVGVENPECFIKFEKLAHLFPQKELIVIMRYLSHSPNKWLQIITNSYLHFGDFDPAGLSIYIREFRNNLPDHRCNFFIPENISCLIEEYGQTSLYDNQLKLIKNIDFGLYPEIKDLAGLLHNSGKGLEQERLLTFANSN